ncbi:hypothetical protein PanWU01x14_330620, partial [Parasponia andersonii]
NVRRGKSCATKNLPADLENVRTMGITSSNKMLTDGSRKRTKREELCNQKLASSPQNNRTMGITSRNKTLADDPRKRTKRKGKQGRDPPVGNGPSLRNILAIQMAKGKQGHDPLVGSGPSLRNILAIRRANGKHALPGGWFICTWAGYERIWSLPVGSSPVPDQT